MTTDLVTQFGGWLGLIAVAIVGVFAFTGVFSGKKRQLKQEESATEDRVMRLLKEQVNALESRVKKQDADLGDLTKKVESLISENHLLRNILQGKDEQTQAFYKDAYAAMEIVKAIAASSKENNTALTKLITLMDGFMRAKN